MPAGRTLVVWLYGTAVGTLRAPRFGRLQLEPSAEGIARWGLGSTIVSVSLPLAPTRPTNDKTLRFFDGLLPEGAMRTSIERRFDVRRGDAFGLLEAIGRDSAGAIELVPPDEQPSPGGTLERLNNEQLLRLVDELSERPLGAEQRVRVSLTGQQDKLLVARLGDDTWARPLDGAPSTWLLKPEDPRLPEFAANEVGCLNLAKSIGLSTVRTELIDIGGQPVAAIERYDRIAGSQGVVRVHQEDFCQALSVDCVNRDRKYQRDGGPSLAMIAQVLDRHGARDDRQRLLRAAVFTTVIGNVDAHGRNFSMLHHADGTASMAPLYDVACITCYDTIDTPRGARRVNHDAAMSINGSYSLKTITRADLEAEGGQWGLSARSVKAAITETLEALRASLGTVILPHKVEQSIRQRLDDLA